MLALYVNMAKVFFRPSFFFQLISRCHMKKFSELSLSTQLLKSLDGLGYKEMTPVQRESLPIVLEGRDLIAQAKTGSGKTAAFGLGLLQKIDRRF